jgi:L-ascorbate metabolism protein UlaG (beta-lactamase superfamily)
MDRRLFPSKLRDSGEPGALEGGSPAAGSVEPEHEAGTSRRVGLVQESLSLREVARRKLHHGGNRFLNPFSARRYGRVSRVLHWKLFSENRFKSHYDQQRIVPVSIDWEPIRHYGGLSVTFLKHASVLIKDHDRYLLVDPVFFSLCRFIKDYTPLAFDIKEMPRPDYVLITHGHYDHLDTRSLARLEQSTHIITPLGYSDILANLGMTRRTELDWFDVFREGRRKITLLPSNHWTMRNPFEGPNRSLWGSFLFESAGGRVIFLSGDMAYFDHFRDIGREYAIDLAIINLGAYEPRWFMASSHMNPAEAVRAFRELGADRLLIVHWGTFRLGDEPVHLPPVEIRREMDRAGFLERLVHLNHGETYFM